MNEFLARFGVPISVVSFEVFELEDGPRTAYVRKLTNRSNRLPLNDATHR